MKLKNISQCREFLEFIDNLKNINIYPEASVDVETLLSYHFTGDQFAYDDYIHGLRTKKELNIPEWGYELANLFKNNDKSLYIEELKNRLILLKNNIKPGIGFLLEKELENLSTVNRLLEK